MSSLTKLKQPTPQAVVQVSDDEGFVVRGLNPVDVFSLYYRHAGEVGDLFQQFVTMAQGGEGVDSVDVASALLSVLRQSPLIVAELIALAAGAKPSEESDWYESVAIARELTFPVQADALEKIGNLTFTSEMPVGKFVALVAKQGTSVTSAIQPYLQR